MRGMIFRDEKMIKKFAEMRKLSKYMSPEFKPTHEFSLTTTPELIGLMRPVGVARFKK